MDSCDIVIALVVATALGFDFTNGALVAFGLYVMLTTKSGSYVGEMST